MNFAQQQRDPRRHLVGITSVVVFHIALIYALANGLGHKVVDVLKKPLDVSLIEEIKKLPPPPKELPPPPKVVPPPPAFVPPPEVQITPPPEAPPVITVTAPTPPPPAPAPSQPAPAVAAPRVASVGVVCPNHVEVRSKVQYPAQAQRMGLSGRVVVEFIVSPNGTIGGVTVAKSSNQIFNSVATAAVAQLHCVGQEQNVRIQVPFVFELDR